MPKYRKKPVVVEAIQVTGRNDAEVGNFLGDCGYDPVSYRPSWVVETFHGPTTALVGDWIIKGGPGDFWPCDPTVFEATYDLDKETSEDNGEEGNA